MFTLIKDKLVLNGSNLCMDNHWIENHTSFMKCGYLMSNQSDRLL
jgi:hypothetical protein